MLPLPPLSLLPLPLLRLLFKSDRDLCRLMVLLALPLLAVPLPLKTFSALALEISAFLN